MRYLVTGASGYLGRGIVKKLIDDGNEVIANDVNCKDVDPRAQIIEADLFAIEKPWECFGGPDVLLHLAWRNGFVHNSTTHLRDLPNHYTFLKDFIDNHVRKIAVMGSMHEIGFYEGCVCDTTPCNPQSFYGIAKNALRQALIVECENNKVNWQWLRGYYIVGDQQYGSSIFSKIYQAVINGQLEFPFTTGENQYDFIDYDDFCTQVVAALTQDEVMEIINICSGYPERLGTRVERFIEENHYPIKLNYGVFPERPYTSKAIWGSNDKISKILEKYKTSHSIGAIKE